MQFSSTNLAAAIFFTLTTTIHSFPKASFAEVHQGQEFLGRISPQLSALHLPVYEPVSLPNTQQIDTFGKRTPVWSWAEVGNEMKRNDAPQPFVRFGRSSGGAESRSASTQDNGQRLSTFDHMFDGSDDAMPNF